LDQAQGDAYLLFGCLPWYVIALAVSLCPQDFFCPSAGTGQYRQMPVCRPGLACRPSSNTRTMNSWHTISRQFKVSSKSTISHLSATSASFVSVLSDVALPCFGVTLVPCVKLCYRLQCKSEDSCFDHFYSRVDGAWGLYGLSRTSAIACSCRSPKKIGEKAMVQTLICFQIFPYYDLNFKFL
jgi:hypothetical protein